MSESNGNTKIPADQARRIVSLERRMGAIPIVAAVSVCGIKVMSQGYDSKETRRPYHQIAGSGNRAQRNDDQRSLGHSG